MHNRIFSKEQIRNNFDACLEYIRSLETQIQDLQYRNEVLLKDAKEIANRELLEENFRLKNQLKFSIGQFSSQKELDDYNSFCEEHVNCGNHGKNPYVRQKGTGIGIITVVKCPICGKVQDITDLEAW